MIIKRGWERSVLFVDGGSSWMTVENLYREPIAFHTRRQIQLLLLAACVIFTSGIHSHQILRTGRCSTTFHHGCLPPVRRFTSVQSHLVHSNFFKEIVMLRKMTVSVFTIIVLTFVCSGFSQETKKEQKNEMQASSQTKQETAKDAKKPNTPPVMKFVSCSKPDCGFWAKSRSGKELRVIMKRHAKKYHKTELTDKQLKEMVKRHEGK